MKKRICSSASELSKPKGVSKSNYNEKINKNININLWDFEDSLFVEKPMNYFDSEITTNSKKKKIKFKKFF